MQPLAPRTSLDEETQAPSRSWLHRLASRVFILICFYVGVFLIIFPWLRSWDRNSIASFAPWVRDLWDSPYFRGALSGLGLVNVYISLAETLRLRRPRPDRLKVSVL